MPLTPGAPAASPQLPPLPTGPILVPCADFCYNIVIGFPPSSFQFRLSLFVFAFAADSFDLLAGA